MFHIETISIEKEKDNINCFKIKQKFTLKYSKKAFTLVFFICGEDMKGKKDKFKLLILADDLTGALDSGVQLISKGLKVLVYTSPQ